MKFMSKIANSDFFYQESSTIENQMLVVSWFLMGDYIDKDQSHTYLNSHCR